MSKQFQITKLFLSLILIHYNVMFVVGCGTSWECVLARWCIKCNPACNNEETFPH